MFETIDIKFVFAILSSTITVVAFYPYISDIFLRKTKPHAYTWLVWVITQGTAVAALWYGGGKFATISLAVGTLLVVFVFFLSLKYGTKNITQGDTFVLIMALSAIVVWWQLKNPLLAVFMVSAIDGLGYIPTYRKSFVNPWTETPTLWLAMIVAGVFALLANAEYNLLTVTYIATLIVANTVLLTLLTVRRKTTHTTLTTGIYNENADEHKVKTPKDIG